MELKNVAAKTNQGPYLNINEDGYDIDLSTNLYMLFDGFGGAGIGDRCVKKLIENIKSFYLKVGGDENATMPFYYSKKYLIEGNALINAIQLAHKKLTIENFKIPHNKKGGASGIFAVLSENIITLISTGNCVGLLYRRGRIYRLINEDNIEVFDSKNINLQFKNFPSSGFGLFEEVHLQIREVKIETGDTLLLLSDGVYDHLSYNDIEFIILECKENYTELIDRLFDHANQKGNLDNQSAIALSF